MNITKKQLIALISVLFVCELVLPGFSKADTIDDLANTKELRNDSNSIIMIKNSPQPILFDAGTPADMAQIEIDLKKALADQKAEVKAYVLAEAKKRGLNPREVELIVNCESRWNPKATHINKNGSMDAGLWQINSIHKNLTLDEKMDYKVATKWALDKRLRDGNWSAWYCARRVGIR